MLGVKQRFKGYAAFVKQGVDDETEKFYGKGNCLASITLSGLAKITKFVATNYQSTPDNLRMMIKGSNSANKPRKIAMYLCQELSGATLIEIAAYLYGTNNHTILMFDWDLLTIAQIY